MPPLWLQCIHFDRLSTSDKLSTGLTEADLTRVVAVVRSLRC